MKKIIFAIMTIASAWGCSEFLEPDSPSEYVPETANALNEMLLGEAYPTHTSSKLFMLHNALDDDIEMSDALLIQRVTSTFENLQLIYSWDPTMMDAYTSGSSTPEALWDTYYEYILGANAAIDYLDDVSGTDAEKAYVAAQAHALRAFYYLNLVNLFGEPYNHNPQALGVPLKLTSDLSTSGMRRNTVGEVYDQIIEDLNTAEEYFLQLPAAQQNPGTYRISLPAVQLLHARTSLYMEDMEEAAKYAQKVIDDWDFDLYDLRNFTKEEEIITGVDAQFPNYATLENVETIWVYGNPSDFTGQTGVLDYLEDATTSRQVLNASQALVDSYDEEGDLRRELYLVEEVQNGTETVTGHYVPWSKCAMQYNHTVKTSQEFGMSLRLSEAYLILAEAVYDTDEAQALQAINDLREKRFNTENFQKTSYSGNELLDFIRKERRRELCFEGQRWFDLRRYGMPSFRHRWIELGEDMGDYVMNEGDAAYTLPIPSDALENNTALEQNTLTETKTLQN